MCGILITLGLGTGRREEHRRPLREENERAERVVLFAECCRKYERTAADTNFTLLKHTTKPISKTRYTFGFTNQTSSLGVKLSVCAAVQAVFVVFRFRPPPPGYPGNVLARASIKRCRFPRKREFSSRGAPWLCVFHSISWSLVGFAVWTRTRPTIPPGQQCCIIGVFSRLSIELPGRVPSRNP